MNLIIIPLKVTKIVVLTQRRLITLTQNFEKEMKYQKWEIMMQKNKSNFYSSNVVKLPKGDYSVVEIYLLQKGLNFVLSCNRINKAKFNVELFAFVIMLCLTLIFDNENKCKNELIVLYLGN